MSRELTPEQQARLTEILGFSPPTEVYDPNFADAYQRVADADPELALAWQESLLEEVEEAPKVKLPVESAAGRARRTRSWRSMLGKVSTRKVEEEDTPTPTLPDQRKLTVSVFAGMFIIAAVIVLATFFTTPQEDGTAGAPEPVAEGPQAVPAPPVTPVVELPPAPEPKPEPAEPVIRSSGPSVTPAPSPAITPPPVVTNTGFDVPPPGMEAAAPTGGVVFLAANNSGPLAETVHRSSPGQPGSSLIYAAAIGSGSIITPTSEQGVLAGLSNSNPVIYQEPTPTGEVVFANAQDLRQNQTMLHSSDYQPSQGSSLIYERLGGDEATPPERPLAPVLIDVPTPVAPSQQTASQGLGQALAAAAAPPAPPTPTAPSPATGLDLAAFDPEPAPQPSTNPVTLRRPDGTSFTPGERIPAALVTSATILDGVPAPVIAETRGEWCNRTTCPTYTFIGTARLLGGNRVIINFNSVVTPEGAQEIEAIALSAEYSTSIPAAIRDETPTIAPDLVRASLNGVAAYADVLANATRVTVDPTGNRTEETVLPDLTALIAGNAARALGLPQSATTVVRLAEIDPGTPVVVTIGLTY